jgi:hypothetical protein
VFMCECVCVDTCEFACLYVCGCVCFCVLVCVGGGVCVEGRGGCVRVCV